MVKFFQVVWMVWRFVSPIYSEVMHIIDEVKKTGLTNDDARKKVFQDVTDFIQARGVKAVPDSVLNTAIELCYQVYLWKKAV